MKIVYDLYGHKTQVLFQEGKDDTKKITLNNVIDIDIKKSGRIISIDLLNTNSLSKLEETDDYININYG